MKKWTSKSFHHFLASNESRAVIHDSLRTMLEPRSIAMRNALQAGCNPINIRLGNSERLGADAEEFVFPQGFDLRFAGGHYCKGISHCIEDLQLVAWFLTGTSLVVFDNGRQIAATEIFLRQVIGERNACEERVFHGLSGYKAMKGGAGFLVAQMETTCKRRRQTVALIFQQGGFSKSRL
jgi:hypothetical protein